MPVLAMENGVDIQRFVVEDDATFWKRELNLDPQKMYAIYSGHLYPEKGIEVILAVAERLQSRKVAYTLGTILSAASNI